MPPKKPPPGQSDYWPSMTISIHGIRTDGKWQTAFASAISSSPQTKIESFDYGRYGLLKLLIPAFNRKLVDRFYLWFARTIKSCPAVDLDSYDKRPSIVAHSLGSWIVGEAMLKYKDIRVDKLILAGSILPRDFDWATLFARDQVNFVRNEYSNKDPWPRWAGRLIVRAGTGGSDGFDWFETVVENAHHKFAHSDATRRPHIEAHWIPVLRRRPVPLALLHGRNIPDRTSFTKALHCTKQIDAELFGSLPYFQDAEIPDGLGVSWTEINPEIYTFLINRKMGKQVGYINAMPITGNCYANVRAGIVADNAIYPKDIVPFSTGNEVKIYIMSIAILEDQRVWGEGLLNSSFVRLITGFLDKLIYYAERHGVRVTHFLAVAWTDPGRKLCSLLSMTSLGQDQFGKDIYEVDLRKKKFLEDPTVLAALRKLLKVYAKLFP